jgi:uncharacterized protein (TIGR03083 family)
MGERTEILKKELQDARDALLQAMDTIVEGDWAKPTSVHGWTVKDVVSHLAYNQPTQPRLIRNILDGKGGTPANFDLAYFNRRGIEKQQGKEIPQLKAELAVGHTETIRLLDEISESDLDKLGNHASAGNTTLEQIFRTIARHDREHTEHIRDALRRQ